ncbi:MAG: hypothetical protein IPH20_01515 [Bacteroidales bacterium]|nr:hypothetical protein [Bacteroidales bacterium]
MRKHIILHRLEPVNRQSCRLSLPEHPEIIKDLKKEFREMDKKKAALKNDLEESNADEKVIEAIILSYRVKIEILDEMLQELRRSEGSQMERQTVDTEL